MRSSGRVWLDWCSLYTLSYSPVIIADDANIDVAARRIIWGKCMNSGQSCIAPDYVLCSPGKRERLVEMMKKAVIEFYGSEVCPSEYPLLISCSCCRTQLSVKTMVESFPLDTTS